MQMALPLTANLNIHHVESVTLTDGVGDGYTFKQLVIRAASDEDDVVVSEMVVFCFMNEKVEEKG